jgi:hypothetical protein
MLRNRMTVIGGVGFGVALALLVTGCESTNDNAAEPDVPAISGAAAPSSEVTSPPPAPPSTPAAPSQVEPAPPAASTPATAANPNECKVADLKLSLAGGEGAAGTVYRQLRFTNIGDRTCVIQGFPGVSFVAGEDGHQVGQPAHRDGTKGPAISLRPGMTVHAPLGFAQVQNYDPAVCRPTEVRGLRVYPPHEYDSMFVPAPGTGCAGEIPGHQLLVRTVQ